MGLSLSEQETIITFNREEKDMEIYTFDPKLIRVFSKFSQEHPELCTHAEPATEMHAHVFVLEKGLVSIRPKRVLTDEQREALRLRAQKTLSRVAEIRPKQPQEE